MQPPVLIRSEDLQYFFQIQNNTWPRRQGSSSSLKYYRATAKVNFTWLRISNDFRLSVRKNFED